MGKPPFGSRTQGDAIRNASGELSIKGNSRASLSMENSSASGVFELIGRGNNLMLTGVAGSYPVADIGFSFDLAVPTANENQNRNTAENVWRKVA